jgi:2-polyprenyl-3-methyl-5-hydroxy-6-metoxy-1,4-benzoquinol methylase
MSKLSDDQSRWDDYGLQQLVAIKKNPDQYIITNSPIGHWSFYDDLLTHLMPIQNRSLLELGCGLGQFSVYLSKLGGRITGVDIGESIISAARALAEVNQVDCKFEQCNILNLPFEDGSYDIILGISILHHLSQADVISALRETSRVIKSNGIAIFVEPVENSKLFSVLQNLIPLGKSGAWGYRPSILNRAEWKRYINALDDRDMTTQELSLAGSNLFSSSQIKAYGFLSRLQRLIGPKHRSKLISLDKFLFKYFSPLHFYSQMVLVKYCK